MIYRETESTELREVHVSHKVFDFRHTWTCDDSYQGRSILNFNQLKRTKIRGKTSPDSLRLRVPTITDPLPEGPGLDPSNALPPAAQTLIITDWGSLSEYQ